MVAPFSRPHVPSLTIPVTLFCCLAQLVACSRAPSEPAGGSPAAATSKGSNPSPAAQGAGAAGPRPSGGTLTWSDPAGWAKVPSNSPVRKATYRIPKVSGDAEDGELAVFYFGKEEGGGVEANVSRWVSQFEGATPEKAKREKQTINGMAVSTVEIGGTYSGSGMPNAPSAPKTKYQLLGAIVEAPDGNYFFKLTGPRDTVEGAHSRFDSLVHSIR